MNNLTLVRAAARTALAGACVGLLSVTTGSDLAPLAAAACIGCLVEALIPSNKDQKDAEEG